MNMPPAPAADHAAAGLPGMSRIGLGCWPLAGMTRDGVTRQDAVATVMAAVEAGIRHLDTAYCYGEAGESERAIAEAVAGRRDKVFLAGKCGIHWEPGRAQRVDGRPERLRREVEESLRRLGTDHLDLLYLHAVDPAVPIEESAAALAQLHVEGKALKIGVSNVNPEQLARFAEVCPLAACQMPYNMLQRDIEERIVPVCREREIAVVVYWPLMKGLLAGGMERTRVFPPSDSRHKYPMFQGIEYQRNLDFVDELRPVASRLGTTLAGLVLAWTAEQPGIGSVLFGATSPGQVAANLPAMTCRIDDDSRETIAAAIARRGPVAGRRAVR